MPIELPTSVERDAVLSAILAQVRRIAALVKDVEPVGDVAPPPVLEDE